MPERTTRSWAAAGEVALAAAGMCLFALFVHSRLPLGVLSAVGLLAAAIALGRCILTEPAPAAILGLGPLSPKATAFGAPGAVVGLGLGLIFRGQYGWPLLPGTLTWFAFPAALIGATEELLYRGYVQGRVRGLGMAGAVVLAAACHTAYKSALFALPPEPAGVTFWVLATITFLGGLGFGALRELSGGVYSPLLAHACFDIIVYGGRTQAPWWVWS